VLFESFGEVVGDSDIRAIRHRRQKQITRIFRPTRPTFIVNFCVAGSRCGCVAAAAEICGIVVCVFFGGVMCGPVLRIP